MEIYLDAGKIVDGNRKELTVEQAKAAWENGLVDDYNLAFKRFADLGFDFDKLKAWYKKR